MEIDLLIYDLSDGNGEIIGKVLNDESIKVIYHTSVLINGHEIYFGGNSKADDCICKTKHKDLSKLNMDNGGIFCYKEGYLEENKSFKPIERIKMGRADITEEELVKYLHRLQHELYDIKCFKKENYNIMKHNCNTFTNTLCKDLLNKEIPVHIQELPNKISKTPIGSMIETFYPDLFTDFDFEQMGLYLEILRKLKKKFKF